MRATITAGDVSVEVRAVRLSDGQYAAALDPTLAPLLGTRDSVEADLVVVDDAGSTTEEQQATVTVVRSGRGWTEARGRLREKRGWARRFARSPSEIVLLTPR